MLLVRFCLQHVAACSLLSDVQVVVPDIGGAYPGGGTADEAWLAGPSRERTDGSGGGGVGGRALSFINIQT